MIMANDSRSRTTTNRPRYRRSYQPKRKVCAFCADKTKTITWKEPDGLRRFVDEGGYIRSRRKTGTCARHQRRLAVAVKRARHMALLPFTLEHVRVMSKG
jgi:small subunit ribosomal protein S18